MAKEEDWRRQSQPSNEFEFKATQWKNYFLPKSVVRTGTVLINKSNTLKVKITLISNKIQFRHQGTHYKLNSIYQYESQSYYHSDHIIIIIMEEDKTNLSIQT